MLPQEQEQPLLLNPTIDYDKGETAYESTEKVQIIGVDEAEEHDSGDYTKIPPFSWKKLWLFTGPGFLMSIA